MKAKEILFEFLETIFFILLILFFIFYLFLGGHYQMAKNIFLVSGFVSLFALFFIRKFKIRKQEVEKLKNDGREEVVCYYLFPKDVFWDRVYLVVLSILVLLVPVAFGTIALNDYFLAGTVFLLTIIWRRILFVNRDELTETISLTRVDCLHDETFVFVMPFVLFVETFFKGGIEPLNIVQAFLAFFGIFFLHWRLFRESA